MADSFGLFYQTMMLNNGFQYATKVHSFNINNTYTTGFSINTSASNYTFLTFSQPILCGQPFIIVDIPQIMYHVNCTTSNATFDNSVFVYIELFLFSNIYKLAESTRVDGISLPLSNVTLTTEPFHAAFVHTGSQFICETMTFNLYANIRIGTTVQMNMSGGNVNTTVEADPITVSYQ